MNPILLLPFILLITLIPIQSYADFPNRIHYDSSTKVLGFHQDIRIDGTGLTATDFEESKDFLNESGTSRSLFTDGTLRIDDSVKILGTINGFGIIGEHVSIFTDERYEEYLNSLLPRQGKDHNSAPSMGGITTMHNDRIFFTGVAEQPVFGSTTTEIFIHNGKAIQEKVYVFFDGCYIDTIDVGIAPSGERHETWIGIGGQRAEIPFEAYNYVTDEGQLIHLGEGYPNVFRDLNQMRTFNEDDGPARQAPTLQETSNALMGQCMPYPEDE